MVHLLLGAVIVSKIKFLPLALLLAFLIHYPLDMLPHWEYSIKNILGKNWKNSFKDFMKVLLDISLGILLIFIFSKSFFLSLLGGLLAILPDGLTLIGLIAPNKLLRAHENFHREIHFFKSAEELESPEVYQRGKKIFPFWGILFEILLIILAIYLLK